MYSYSKSYLFLCVSNDLVFLHTNFQIQATSAWNDRQDVLVTELNADKYKAHLIKFL